MTQRTKIVSTRVSGETRETLIRIFPTLSVSSAIDLVIDLIESSKIINDEMTKLMSSRIAEKVHHQNIRIESNPDYIHTSDLTIESYARSLPKDSEESKQAIADLWLLDRAKKAQASKVIESEEVVALSWGSS